MTSFLPERTVEISYGWKRTDYRYPEAVSDEFKTSYDIAAVYRWAIWPTNAANQSSHPCAHYVGETENLRERVGEYLHPRKNKPSTEQRVTERLDEELARRRRIELHTLWFEPFQLIISGANPIICSTDELDDPFIRKMMENLAILARPSGCELLNLVIDPISRKARTAQETRRLLADPKGRERLYVDRDVKPVLDFIKRREQAESNAKEN
jgi:hypothetical protein